MAKIDRYAIIFVPDKEGIMLRCWPEEGLNLKELQDIVDGNIETVGTMLAPGWAQEKGVTPVLIINEEGKLRGLPYNDAATIMAHIAATDEIVGNAVLMLARGDELIGFKESAARNIIKEWSAVPEEDE